MVDKAKFYAAKVEQSQLDELSVRDLVAFQGALRRIYDTIDAENNRSHFDDNKAEDILLYLSGYFAELVDRSIATLIAKVPLTLPDSQLRARAILAYAIDFQSSSDILGKFEELKADLKEENSQPNITRGR